MICAALGFVSSAVGFTPSCENGFSLLDGVAVVVVVFASWVFAGSSEDATSVVGPLLAGDAPFVLPAWFPPSFARRFARI